MKRGVIGKFAFTLVLFTFLLSGVFAVESGTCEITTSANCDDALTEGYRVMGLSSATNSHGQFPYVDYPYVLCCQVGTGNTLCKSTTNKIIGLSSSTNAHAEAKTGVLYNTPVCYEDIACIISDNSCPTGYNGILSLSALTNAHIGPLSEFSNKVCCSQSSMPGVIPCEIESVEWSGSSAVEGTAVGLYVHGNGAQCGGKTIYLEVWKDNLIAADTLAITQPVDVGFNGDIAEGIWTTELAGSNYYFKASLLADMTGSLNSGNINVLNADWCTENSIESCEDYAEEDCESRLESGSDLCSVAEDFPPEGVTCSESSPCNCRWDDEQGVCGFNWEFNSLGSCGDGVVNRPNNNGAKEDCDPDSGTDFFEDNENTCLKLSSLTPAMNGYTGGTLKCGFTCAFDTTSCTPSNPTCGNNIVDQLSESCDGSHLAGQSCETVGYLGGILGCDSSCQLDKSGCTEPTAEAGGYCGDGDVGLNGGNFNEQCDPSDGPAGDGIVNLNGKSCTSVGLGTGSLSCKSNCELDYSGCSGTKTCGDGVVDQISEDCDKTDFQGITCAYLGFNEGTLSCDASCKADSSSCEGGETGTSSSCSYTSTVLTSCEDGEGQKTIQWSGEWTGGEASGEAYTNCITPITKVYPCPAYVQLPFFDYLQMAVAMLIIAGIYGLSIFISKFKKKNKK